MPASYRLAAALAVACCLAACSTVSEAGGAAPAGSPQPASSATAVCRPVENVPVQGGGHLIGDREPPVPYNSTPPTSGWHTSGAFAIEVRDAADPLTEPEQVSVLEVGGVVVTHRGLAPDDLAAVETAAARFPGRVAVTPYEALDEGTVVFTAWGALQRCDGIDTTALADFVDTFADPEPATPGEH